MKKDLYDMLQEASPGDIDLLWGGIHSEKIDEITAQRIREAAFTKAGLKNRGKVAPARRYLRRIAAAIACLMLTVGLAFGGRAYAADVKEYKAAVAFFQENDMDAEGLTRGELKSVYRDIVTETFCYDKTAEVIERSLHSDRVESYDIFQTEPDPAEVEALWRYRKAVFSETATGWYRPDVTGVHYEIMISPGNIFCWATLYRYEGEKKVWSAHFTDFIMGIRYYCPLSDGVLVWGTTPDQQYIDDILVESEVRSAYLAKVGADGELLRQLRLENSSPYEIAYAAVDNGNGTYAIFTVAETGPDVALLYLTQVDGTGQVLSSQQVCETSVFTNVDQAVKMGDGYLLSSFIPDESGRTSLAEVTGDGELTAVQAFQSKGKTYLVSHILSYGGRAYLSAWDVPSGEESAPYAVLNERIRSYLADNGVTEIPNDTLTEMVQETFSAALLVLDSSGSTPVEL